MHLLDRPSHHLDIFFFEVAQVALGGGREVLDVLDAQAHHAAGGGVEGDRVLAPHHAAEIHRDGGVRPEALGRADEVGDGQIGPDHRPHVHHGGGQVGHMHLLVGEVLHHALHVLERAGEHHAGVALEDGQVEEMLGFQEEAGELDLLDIGARVPDGDVDKVFLPFYVDEPGAGGLGRGADAAHVEHVQRVAADGGGLGHDDLLGLGLLDLLDHGRHQFGAGVDRGLGSCGVTGVGLQHHGAPGLHEVLRPLPGGRRPRLPSSRGRDPWLWRRAIWAFPYLRCSDVCGGHVCAGVSLALSALILASKRSNILAEPLRVISVSRPSR